MTKRLHVNYAGGIFAVKNIYRAKKQLIIRDKKINLLLTYFIFVIK